MCQKYRVCTADVLNGNRNTHYKIVQTEESNGVHAESCAEIHTHDLHSRVRQHDRHMFRRGWQSQVLTRAAW